MPEHATPPVPLTAAFRSTETTRGPGASRSPEASRSARAFSGTGAGPCAWPVASAAYPPGPPAVTPPIAVPGRGATTTPRGGPAPAVPWPLTTVGTLRSRAFIECPGSQIAAIARARAMAAMASADTLVAPVPLRLAEEPEPGAALPPADHPGPERHCMGTFRGQREQAGQARAFLAAFLGGWARVDDALLLIGELSANAVVHTGSGAPGGLFTVRATLAGAWLRAEVEDQGSNWNGRLEEAECPHGLFLLRQLATRCGTRRVRGGWVTWFVLGDVSVAESGT
jgi:Histidine kinase-like ATPase domain